MIAPKRLLLAVERLAVSGESALAYWWNALDHRRTREVMAQQQWALDPLRAGIECLQEHYRAAFAGQAGPLAGLDAFLDDQSPGPRCCTRKPVAAKPRCWRIGPIPCSSVVTGRWSSSR